jgi:hypothetical protein
MMFLVAELKRLSIADPNSLNETLGRVIVQGTAGISILSTGVNIWTISGRSFTPS